MKVSLFPGCLVDQFYPDVGFAALRVLGRAGVEVVYNPGLTCCGQPAFNSGYRREARRVADAFLRAADDGLPIVSLSGSCTAMIKVFLPELYGEPGAEAARSVGERTREFADFLIGELGDPEIDSPFEGVVVYHDSCHALRELGIAAPPRQLLERVPGVELREVDDGRRCCGFGGLFSTGYPELSAAIGREKIEALQRTGAQWVVSGDVSCLMHLDGLLRRERAVDLKVLHLAQVLDPGEAAA